MELIMATRGRPKGSTNKKHPDFPIKGTELEKLRNLVARQDDQIIQMCDDINQFKKEIAKLDEDVGLLEGKIESYREILKTLLEISE
jgi:septal ring factor EnvC (AmiA/AmiB activator)